MTRSVREAPARARPAKSVSSDTPRRCLQRSASEARSRLAHRAHRRPGFAGGLGRGAKIVARLVGGAGRGEHVVGKIAHRFLETCGARELPHFSVFHGWLLLSATNVSTRSRFGGGREPFRSSDGSRWIPNTSDS